MADEVSADARGAVPAWYWVAAVGALLFELLGCVMYLLQVSTDPAALRVDERAMWQSTPTWMVAAYAIAVWAGLAGAVCLLLRRRWAVPLLLISFIAVVVQFSGLLIVPELRSVTPSDALLGPIIIIVLSGAILRLGVQARRCGWLR